MGFRRRDALKAGAIGSVTLIAGMLGRKFVGSTDERTDPDGTPAGGRTTSSPSGTPTATDAPRLDLSWPQWRGDAGNTSVGSGASLAAVRPVERWSYEKPETGDTHTRLVARGSQIVLSGRSSNQVIALDAATGEPEWTSHVGDASFASTPTISDDVVVTGGSRETFATDRRSGEVEWSRPFEGEHKSTVTLADGVVFGHDGGSGLYAASVTTGELLWSERGDAGSVGAPAVDGDGVYTVSGDGVVQAVSRADGNERWTASIDGRRVRGVAARDGRVFAASDDDRDSEGTFYPGEITAFDADDGGQIWRYQIGERYDGSLFRTPMITRDFVVASVMDEDHAGIVALDVETGDVVWTVDNRYATGAFGTEQTVLVDAGGQLVALEAATGRERWRHDVPRAHEYALGGSWLFSAGTDGVVRGFELYPVRPGTTDAPSETAAPTEDTPEPTPDRSTPTATEPPVTLSGSMAAGNAYANVTHEDGPVIPKGAHWATWSPDLTEHSLPFAISQGETVYLYRDAGSSEIRISKSPPDGETTPLNRGIAVLFSRDEPRRELGKTSIGPR